MNRVCKNCNHEVAENDKFCPNCGSPQELSNSPNFKSEENSLFVFFKKWFLSLQWFASISLMIIGFLMFCGVCCTNMTFNQQHLVYYFLSGVIFFPPFTAFLNKKYNFNFHFGKKILAVFCALIFSLLFLPRQEKETKVTTKSTATQSQPAPVAVHPAENATITRLISVLGVPKQNAQKINNTLRLCGINNIANISYDDFLDYDNGTKGYRIDTANEHNIIIYIKPNHKIFKIRYMGKDLYKNGKAISTITGAKIKTDKEIKQAEKKSKPIAIVQPLTLDEKSIAEYNCKEIIKQSLSAPSTAKFPWSLDEWAFGKKNGITIVQSYVDAENNFGAMLRAPFECRFAGQTPTLVKFNGETVYRRK